MSDVATERALPSADDLVLDILDLTVAAPLALGAFVSLSAVEWSTSVTTACVECTARPRLLLNPDFVRAHCSTRERLAFLVLHELCHVSLGHTRLYPRLTPLHNVAFDAVINATVMDWLNARHVALPPYAALVTGFYHAGETPLFILRPPPGWPEAPDWEASAECPEPLRALHRRLYSDSLVVRSGVTYTEIVQALVGAGGGDDDVLGRLLGGHGLTSEEQAAESGGRDAALHELLPNLMVRLPSDGEHAGWGPAAGKSQLVIEQHRAERRLQQALTGLLRRVFTKQSTGVVRSSFVPRPILSVDPARDRRAPARRMLAAHFGAPRPLLFDSHLLEARPDRLAATIYLDVSGSMMGQLERLHAALVPLRGMLTSEVFAFSCGVAPAPLAEFVAGRVTTRYGTEITSVLRHAAKAATRRALVLTDGYFAVPDARAVQQLALSGAELHLAIIGGGPLPSGSWVASATRLPDPNSTRG